MRGGDTCGAESRAMLIPILRIRFATSSRLRFEFLATDEAVLFDSLGLAGADLAVSAGTCFVVFATSGVDFELEPEVCDCGTNPRPGISCSKPDPLRGSPPTSAKTDDTVGEAIEVVDGG